MEERSKEGLSFFFLFYPIDSQNEFVEIIKQAPVNYYSTAEDIVNETLKLIKQIQNTGLILEEKSKIEIFIKGANSFNMHSVVRQLLEKIIPN